MPLPIIEENASKPLNGRAIKKSEIDQLMARYSVHTGKRKTTGGSFKKHNTVNDTKSGWFPLNDILGFLVANGVQLQYSNVDDLGIRIYFGMHHEKNSYQPLPALPTTPVDAYHFKDTPILVFTKKNAEDPNMQDDQLTANNFVILAGEGLDNARLCPPECNGGM